MYSYGPPHMAKQKQDNQIELTYSSYVRTQDVTLKTCQRRWMIGRSGERGSGISMLAARHDDDDDDKGLLLLFVTYNYTTEYKQKWLSFNRNGYFKPYYCIWIISIRKECLKPYDCVQANDYYDIQIMKCY